MFWLLLLLFLFPWETDLRKHWHDLHQRMFCPCSLLMGGCVQSLSHVLLFVTPWTVACQAPLSMSFCRKEYWSGLSFPSPGDLPDPGIKSTPLVSPALAVRFFTTSARWEFNGAISYIEVFKPSWVYFCVWYESIFYLYWFSCGYATFQTSLDEEIVFSLFYIFWPPLSKTNWP